MAASARNSESGLTLVELTIAMAIVFIVFLGLTQSGLVALEHNIKNTLGEEAVSVAETVMIQTRNTPFDNLAVSPAFSDNVVRAIRGLSKSYRVTRTVDPLDLDTLQVAVNVEWDRVDPFSRATRTYNHRISTIMRRR